MKTAYGPLGLLLVVRLALGLTYSLVVPPWESYDEDGHFAYARYLAKYRTLLQPGDPEAEQVWEKFQPPLYYILIAPALAGFDLGPTFQLPERNPYLPNGNAGLNYALHPDQPTGAARQLELALHAGRAVSVVASTLSVIFVFLTARLIWPARPGAAWAATCLYAFWPQFVFVGSMVTNDALATALAPALFYGSVHLARHGFRLWPALGLGTALGLALLTKLNALAFVPLVVAAFLVSLIGHVRRPANWRSPSLWMAFAVMGAFIAATLWFLSSLEFVASHIFHFRTVAQFLELAPRLSPEGGRTESAFVLASLQYGFRTYFASFGWGNLETFSWLYPLWAGAASVSAAGLVLAAAREIGHRVGRSKPGPRPRPQIDGWEIICLGLMVLAFASIVALTLGLAISQQNIFLVPGRYMLPSLPAVAILLVAGWRIWLPQPVRPIAWKASSAGVLLVAWLMPIQTLAPAYAKPRPLESSPAPVRYFPSPLWVGDRIQALGYVEPDAVSPGADWRVSLCWQATAPVMRNYPVLLEVVGPDGQGYGRLETYPGRGNYPTSMWAVDRPFCDEYFLSVGQDIPAPSAAGLRVALLRDVAGEKLPVTIGAAEGEEASIWVPARVAAPEAAPPLPQSADYRFGSGVRLTGFDLRPLPAGERGVSVLLRWEALEDIHEDYTVFVHLRDTPDTAFSQKDQEPRAGWYPTSYWRRGDIVLDEHLLYFPAGRSIPALDLYVGLYASATGTRLPVYDRGGDELPQGELLLRPGLVFPLADSAAPVGNGP